MTREHSHSAPEFQPLLSSCTAILSMGLPSLVCYLMIVTGFSISSSCDIPSWKKKGSTCLSLSVSSCLERDVLPKDFLLCLLARTGSQGSTCWGVREGEYFQLGPLPYWMK